MIKTRKQQTIQRIYNKEKKHAFDLYDLKEFDGISNKLKQFSYVELEPNEEVAFHVHEGNTENYYIIKGKGLYNDNGKEMSVGDGDVTFTPSGHGHALKNVGTEKLSFIALVVIND